MNRTILIFFILAVSMFLGGCASHRITVPEGGQVADDEVSLDNTEVTGGVDSSGKYTGNDGVSRSGFKMLYFGYNRYQLDSEQVQRVMDDLPRIARLARKSMIRIEGNCDEFGTDEFNYALGLKRAKAVKALLVSNGIPASKISVVSYGESNPTCRGKTPACHAKNRRAEINGVHE